jgi:hypothetical protein
VNNNLERMWEAAILAYFKELPWNLTLRLKKAMNIYSG